MFSNSNLFRSSLILDSNFLFRFSNFFVFCFDSDFLFCLLISLRFYFDSYLLISVILFLLDQSSLAHFDFTTPKNIDIYSLYYGYKFSYTLISIICFSI